MAEIEAKKAAYEAVVRAKQRAVGGSRIQSVNDDLFRPVETGLGRIAADYMARNEKRVRRCAERQRSIQAATVPAGAMIEKFSRDIMLPGLRIRDVGRRTGMTTRFRSG